MLGTDQPFLRFLCIKKSTRMKCKALESSIKSVALETIGYIYNPSESVGYGCGVKTIPCEVTVGNWDFVSIKHVRCSSVLLKRFSWGQPTHGLAYLETDPAVEQIIQNPMNINENVRFQDFLWIKRGHNYVQVSEYLHCMPKRSCGVRTCHIAGTAMLSHALVMLTGAVVDAELDASHFLIFIGSFNEPASCDAIMRLPS